ncbi:MAG: SDR family NAD(P)-dependent oxidoreductase [Alphaproteobacteria bacterium]|nr:SDR family NAD(P)-dependent oxidoreductase [Alphaproteobacteria bacterium]MCB9792152.1 SDR family NAD(P)-dependent oxidoreductase [Alphaproteobacteria bacterium]
MTGRFQDKVVVITGATSGIGRSLAARMAQEGAIVVGGGRDQGRLAELAREISLALTLDLTREASVEVFAAAALDTHGRVDLLINNAGVGRFAPFLETPPEDFRRLFELNVIGAVRLTQALLPAMLERGEGRIVNVASVAGVRGYQRLSAYGASKFAMVGWSETLAAELVGTGVEVTVVCPPAVDTPFFENAGYPEHREARGPWPLMSADACAARIVDAVAQGRRRALLGPKAKLSYALSTLAPGLVERLKGRR